MKPIDPGEEYGRLVVYGADQPEYLPLPSRVTDDGLAAAFTLWELSFDERQAILDGARIGLQILTFGRAMQPVYLAVEGTEGWPYEPPQAAPGGKT